MENQIGVHDVGAAGAMGTVRVNMLANMEALLNILANSVELVVIVIGLTCVIFGLITYKKSLRGEAAGVRGAQMRAHFGVALIKVGLIVPALVNWCVAAARDANLFY